MALQDILAAITQQTDRKISEARTAQQQSLSAAREESERRIAKEKQVIALQKEQKKQQLLAKAKAGAQSHQRNRSLAKKQELLDMLYAKVAKNMGNIDDKEIEPLLRACIKQIKVKGFIHAAEKHANLLKKISPSEQFKQAEPSKASGGFLFVSEKQEEDYTFQHIVQEMLRPKTELNTAESLFN